MQLQHTKYCVDMSFAHGNQIKCPSGLSYNGAHGEVVGMKMKEKYKMKWEIETKLGECSKVIL